MDLRVGGGDLQFGVGVRFEIQGLDSCMWLRMRPKYEITVSVGGMGLQCSHRTAYSGNGV